MKRSQLKFLVFLCALAGVRLLAQQSSPPKNASPGLDETVSYMNDKIEHIGDSDRFVMPGWFTVDKKSGEIWYRFFNGRVPCCSEDLWGALATDLNPDEVRINGTTILIYCPDHRACWESWSRKIAATVPESDLTTAAGSDNIGDVWGWYRLKFREGVVDGFNPRSRFVTWGGTPYPVGSDTYMEINLTGNTRDVESFANALAHLITLVKKLPIHSDDPFAPK